MRRPRVDDRREDGVDAARQGVDVLVERGVRLLVGSSSARAGPVAVVEADAEDGDGGGEVGVVGVGADGEARALQMAGEGS